MTESDFSDAMAHNLFKCLADLSFNAITITRASGAGGSEIVYVNDAFTELTGYPANEVIGSTPGMLQGPKTDRAVLDRLDQAIRRGDTFEGRTINYRRDGSEFEIEWKVMPVTIDGEVTHYLAVQREASAA